MIKCGRGWVGKKELERKDEEEKVMTVYSCDLIRVLVVFQKVAEAPNLCCGGC